MFITKENTYLNQVCTTHNKIIVAIWIHSLYSKVFIGEQIIGELHRILHLPINGSNIDLTIKTIEQPALNDNDQEVSCAPLCITVPHSQKYKMVKKLFAAYTKGFNEKTFPYLSR